MSVRVSCDSWYHSEKSVDLFIAEIDIFVYVLSRKSRVSIRLKGRVRRYCWDQHTHGMSIVSENFHLGRQISMKHSVCHDFVVEGPQLIFWRELSVDQQKSYFEEWRIFCKLFDGIASILQNSFVAIDVANLRSITYSVHIPWVIDSGGFLGAILDFLDVLAIDEIAVFALLDTDIVLLTCSVISNLQSVALDHFCVLADQGWFDLLKPLHVFAEILSAMTSHLFAYLTLFKKL